MNFDVSDTNSRLVEAILRKRLVLIYPSRIPDCIAKQCVYAQLAP